MIIIRQLEVNFCLVGQSGRTKLASQPHLRVLILHFINLNDLFFLNIFRKNSCLQIDTIFLKLHILIEF